MENLLDRMKVVHTFVPVQTPWVNRTIERSCDYYSLRTTLTPKSKTNLNQSPVKALMGEHPLNCSPACKYRPAEYGATSAKCADERQADVY
ncbi:uncharacterized protein CCR75_005763 [Bremia lactucae]|uniref:Uncharacterized protein n=1 Tax=Bremia lactucae TaxID=4779 RepID=A0A976FG88_BRELC|nr:hypothetical protein CCR75_005763 [Bremia lactucae]